MVFGFLYVLITIPKVDFAFLGHCFNKYRNDDYKIDATNEANPILKLY